MLDSDFNKLEQELKDINSPVVELVDFPSEKEIKNLGLKIENIVDKVIRDEKKYKHLTPMLSLEKIQINDENNFPMSSLTNFFSRLKPEYYYAMLKYDGNGIEYIYKNGKLFQGLTRGDKIEGSDKTETLKHLVPKNIKFTDKTYQIRGEVVIEISVWDKKYNNPEPEKICNPRNTISGFISRENLNLDTLKDLYFVAYDITIIDETNNTISYPENTMEILKELGFNSKYDPYVKKIYSVDEFIDTYYEFKKLRDESKFLIDGIVIKYPEKNRLRMGETGHHPKHSIAIKFPENEVSTTIIDIEWSMGSDSCLCPTAILKPVELLGTIVKRATISNFSTMLRNRYFIGATCSLRKAGAIIPQLTGLIEPSPDEAEYIKLFEDYVKRKMI